MPVLHLAVGITTTGTPLKTNCEILADTGCLPNCVSEQLVQELDLERLDVRKSDLPTFEMLNGSMDRPVGMCQVPIWLSANTMIQIRAYIVRGQSYDIALGSSEFRVRHAAIDYDQCQAYFYVNNKVIEIPFAMGGVD
jgi:hypothetical protein